MVVSLGMLLASVGVFIACDNASMLTEPDSPSAVGSSPSGYVTGTTTALLFATTAPPPPAPTPDEPESESTTPTDDGLERMRSIVLSVDQSCPGCTITTRRGRAFVPESADVLSGGPGDASPISFDQLNAALAPGVPVHIVAAKSTDGTDPVARSVRVERAFAVTGTIDMSSAELESSRQFTLTFDSENGPVPLDYSLADEALVESFQAGERVFVSGTTTDAGFKAFVVRRDD